MKFLCPRCKSKYQISDQKVAGKTLKMTCRQCGDEIVIRGSAAPAPPVGAPPPPAAAGGGLGADFRRQMGSRASTPGPVGAAGPDEWHVAINDIPVGPMRREEVGRKIAAGAVSADSLAWREGLDDWLPAATIPELAVLFQGMAGAPAPPPPAGPIEPASRAAVAPMGGRIAAMPTPAPPPPAAMPVPPPAAAMAADNTGVSVVQALPTDPKQTNWAVVFLSLCGVAFILLAGAVLGKKLLEPTPSPVAAVPEGQTAPGVADEAAYDVEDEEAADEHVIALELEEIDGEYASGKPRGGARPAKKRSTKQGGKQLSAEEKARLARMGGGFSNAPNKLRKRGGSGDRAGGPKGEGLTAAQLSKVVNKGRRNLQRCYETALRKSGSEDAIRLDIEITISSSGNVTKVKPKGQGLPGMDVCITRTARMWRFPSSGSSTTTKFPVVFQPGA